MDPPPPCPSPIVRIHTDLGHRRSSSDPLSRSSAANGSDSPKRLRSGDLKAVKPSPLRIETTESPGETFDCAICSGPMTDPAVGGGCAHHFCAPCYESWIAVRASCPTCRAPVWSITRDPEFAKLIGVECSHAPTPPPPPPSSANPPISNGTRLVRLPGPAGLTITNSSAGCLVTKVVRGNGGDAAGIKVGDLITAVNGTAVRDHQVCVEFIERRCRAGDCEVELRPRFSLMDTLHANTSQLLRGVAPARRFFHRIASGSGSAAAPVSPMTVENEGGGGDVLTVTSMQRASERVYMPLAAASAAAPVARASRPGWSSTPSTRVS